MAIRFVFDEQLRHAVRKYNSYGPYPFDAVWVGEPPDLPLGSLDPDILIWAEATDRILVCYDKRTMAGHLQKHLHAGHHSPGVFLIRDGSRIDDIIDEIALRAYAGDPAYYVDRIDIIP